MKPTPMIVNTRRLFDRLLRSLRISDVCDVGSMNGEDAVAAMHLPSGS